MIILKILLITVEVICSLLLIGVVLLQRSKGEGLGLAFGAQMGESLFGARASNVLVKITVWLGVIFLVTTTLLARLYTNRAQAPLMSRQAPVERPAVPLLPAGAELPAATLPEAIPAAEPVAAPPPPAAIPPSAAEPPVSLPPSDG